MEKFSDVFIYNTKVHLIFLRHFSECSSRIKQNAQENWIKLTSSVSYFLNLSHKFDCINICLTALSTDKMKKKIQQYWASEINYS